MRLACFSFTDKGFELGERISKTDNNKYEIEHYDNSALDNGVKGFLKSQWRNFDGFIFISATGIAIRMINPYIKSKTIDPAVVVVDDMGRFSISLLSGHIGGANKIAEWIGKSIDAIPVVTTASDNRGIDSIDIFAKTNDYYIEDMNSVTKITSMMVNGKRVGFYTEDNQIIKYHNIERINDLKNIDESLDGAIIVSSKEVIPQISIPYTILRPKNINIGIGCRRGVDVDTIIEAVEAALIDKNLCARSIRALSTIEIKKNEIGIIKAAEYYDCPLKIFNIEQIRPIEDMFEKSQFVKNTIGVYSVSEPCAYLLGGNLITRKAVYNGVTISISIKEEK